MGGEDNKANKETNIYSQCCDIGVCFQGCNCSITTPLKTKHRDVHLTDDTFPFLSSSASEDVASILRYKNVSILFSSMYIDSCMKNSVYLFATALQSKVPSLVGQFLIYLGLLWDVCVQRVLW